MRCRCVLGLSAELALPFRQGPARIVMRPPALYARGRNSVNHLHIRKPHSSSHPHSWTITPPHPPSVHPVPSTEDHAHPLSHQIRTLMRLLSHSVVVCTSTSPATGTPHHKSPAPRAMTMSSFTSLALMPTPVVSFNIATPSRTFDAVQASRKFNIHILADDVEGARVADWLSKGNAGGKQVFERLEGECGCEVEVAVGDEPPVIRGPGVLYVLRCRLLEEPMDGLVRVRDHVIVLGEVVEILEGERHEEGHKRRGKHDRFGLLYTDRRYRQLGGCITPIKEGEEEP